MFIVLLLESAPLLQRPSLHLLSSVPRPLPHHIQPKTLLYDNRFGDYIFGLTSDGQLCLFDGVKFELSLPCEQVFTQEQRPSLFTTDEWSHALSYFIPPSTIGVLIPSIEWSRKTQSVVPGSLTYIKNEFELPEPVQEASLIAHRLHVDEELSGVLTLATPNKVILITLEKTESLFGEAEIELNTYTFEPPSPHAPITALGVGERFLYVGTQDGSLYELSLQNPDTTTLRQLPSPHTAKIQVLSPLIGYESIVAGDSNGYITVWFPLQDDQGIFRPVRTRTFQLDPSPIIFMEPDAQTRAFWVVQENGQLSWIHSTTETIRLKARSQLKTPPEVLQLNPGRTYFLLCDTSSSCFPYRFSDPYPESSWKTFFAKLWYEGYPEKAWVWQSTSGTASFEPKYSFVPLIFGTLKGAFYAMLFAIPLALLGALALGYLVHPRIRSFFKPTIELMAGLPSVVLGFIGGLWLAPQVEQWFPALVAIPIFLLFSSVLAPLIWIRVRIYLQTSSPFVQQSIQLIYTTFWVIFALILPFLFNDTIEYILFFGNYSDFFRTVFGWRHETRNALVVGFAMGYAIIPIILSIADDAIEKVPRSWVNGALALGANQWQVLRHIIIPAASSGIVSSIMLGFGRAIGETMIVLMATGNTPVIELNPFSGFRTLSANLAVELPEAPVGSEHYKILFLSALLLFIMTIIINTLADYVRERTRKKYYR